MEDEIRTDPLLGAEAEKRTTSRPSLSFALRTAWSVVKETVDAVDEHEIPVRSAALAYYGLLSLFPLLLFLIIIGTQLLQIGDASQQLEEFLQRVIPVPEVLTFVEGVIEQSIARRGSVGLISALVLLWTASSLFANLEASLNVIWGAPRRMVYYRRLLGIVTVLILGVVFLLAIIVSTLQAVPLLDEIMPYLDELDLGVSLFISILFFWLLYRWMPNAPIPWRPSLAGAILAGVAWQIAQFGFRWYLTSGLANYGAVYGALASLIGLVLWAFLTGMILFVGAVFSAVLQRRFWEPIDDSTAA